MDFLTSENIILTGSILLIAGVLIGKMSYRLGLPLLLIFLLVGIAFGTDGLGIQFEDMHVAQFIGIIALCIILFTGGLGTRMSAIRPVLVPGLLLSTVGVLLTALLTGLFICWLSGMTWTNIHFTILTSLLLAATMSSTDSASVFGILGTQKVHLRYHLRPMLELESGSNDPMAYMLTIVLIEIINTGADASAGVVLLELLRQFGVGGIGGYVFGKLVLRLAALYTRIGGRRAADEDSGQASSMISIIMLGGVFLAFAVTSDFGGNGYLAVYLCGMVIGNSKIPWSRATHKYFDSMTWLAQIVVFLMLGLLVNPHEMLVVAPVSLIIGVFMILVGRPVSVFACLLPLRKINFRSKMFVSWVGLRGAVPIIFATYPVVEHVEGASHIFNIVFFVTLLSLLLQGTTVISTARALKLVDDRVDDDEDFGVELADNLPTVLEKIKLTEEDLVNGNTLASLTLPQGRLVILIKRGERYIVPNGHRKLCPGDSLLLISEEH